jgi:hypothetical protein
MNVRNVSHVVASVLSQVQLIPQLSVEALRTAKGLAWALGKGVRLGRREPANLSGVRMRGG